MVAEASRKTSTTSVISFAPRQILLQAQTMKGKASSEAVQNGSEVKAPKLDKKRRKELSRMGALLQSVAAFLDRGGFPATLSALQSEANLEVDSWKANSVDLEEMYCHYSKSSENPTNASSKDFNGQDSGKDNNLKKANGKAHHKKEKEETIEIEMGGSTSKDEGEEPRKKKRKESSDANSKCKKADADNMEITTDNRGLDVDGLHAESTDNRKKKKNKKKDLSSDSPVDRAKSMNAQISHASDGVKLHDSVAQSKEEKRKKKEKKSVLDSSTENIELVSSKGKSADGNVPDTKQGKATSKEIAVDADVTFTDKQKRKNKSQSDTPQMGLKENDVLLENGDVVKKKDSKKRKQCDGEETDPVINGIGGGVEEKGVEKPSQEHGTLLPDENCAPSKKRKVEKNKDNNKEGDLKDTKETPGVSDEPDKENGSTVKSTTGGLTSKTSRKEHNDSAEPKTVNAFRRVNIDEVQFADERLQDNSYWAKLGAETGYGAKAQEVLGQVRGRDFRHEKTKKKRGSYRGGQIDLQSHSIKFNYSDDE